MGTSTTKIPPLTSNSPYFGRAWTVTITQAQTVPVVNKEGKMQNIEAPYGEAITISNSSWDTEALRVTFETEIVTQSTFSNCFVEIWNANAPTQQRLISFGDFVTISAGYQKGFVAYNQVIWFGRVFQPTFERRDVTDFVIRLFCVNGLFTGVGNWASFSQAALASQLDVVQRMAYTASNQIVLDNDNIDSDALSQTRLPRAQVVHGDPDLYFTQAAQLAGLKSWTGPKGTNIRALQPKDNNQPAAYTFGPAFPPDVTLRFGSSKELADYTPTLIGTPQQTQQGVTFRIQMDSRPQLGDIVALDLSVIRLLPRYPGNISNVLDQSNRFVVFAIRHYGDTYGEDWYTEIEGLSLNFWPALEAGIAGNRSPTL